MRNNHPNRGGHRRPERPSANTQCFLGVLYPYQQILWHFGGEFPTKMINDLVQHVSDPAFWERVDAVSTGNFGRTVGRLVEILALKDPQYERMAKMLALAAIGMSQQKFLWLKVETGDDKLAPKGKTLEASFKLLPKVLDATTERAARRLFFDDMEVGLASNKMWLLPGADGEKVLDSVRAGKGIPGRTGSGGRHSG